MNKQGVPCKPSPAPPRPGNPPAFPETYTGSTEGLEWTGYREGMTLRDYFAGQVLNGLSSNTNAFMNTNSETTADICYSQADEMLKARGL